MSTQELALAAAEAIASAVARQGAAAWHANETVYDIAEPIIRGALERVRAEERRAIVAFLRRRAQAESVYVASLEGDANRIENGEHAGETTP